MTETFSTSFTGHRLSQFAWIATVSGFVSLCATACGGPESGETSNANAGASGQLTAGGTGSANNGGVTNQGGTVSTGGGPTGGAPPSGGAAGMGGVTGGSAGMDTAGTTNGGSGGMPPCPGGNLGCPCLANDACSDGHTCVGGTCESTIPGPEDNCVLRTFEGRNYFFCDNPVEKANAIQGCASVDMKVVRIDDDAEDAFITGVIDGGCCPTSMSLDKLWPGLYIGASDAQTPNEWLWEDDGTVFWEGTFEGMAVGAHYANWFEGQPNDPFPEEMCARTDGLGWYDVACVPGDFGYGDFLGLGYICEEL